MLIISRKCNESFIIDGKIEVVVTDISAGQVRIGIKAPKDCKIWRKELYQTIKYNQQASEGASSEQIRNIFSQLSEQNSNS